MYYDALEEIENNIPIDGEIPNDQFDDNGTIVATFNSILDVDQFCNTYNHDNKYNGLKIGNRIQINDGVYNKDWVIAGFDMEYNLQNVDGRIRNNGYGICLIPTIHLGVKVQWTNSTSRIPLAASTIYNSTLPTVANVLLGVLGNHLIERTVLINDSYWSGWEYPYFKDGINESESSVRKAYCTLLTRRQIGHLNNSLYFIPSYMSDANNREGNIGEGDYILPIYYCTTKYKYPLFLNYTSDDYYWTRESYININDNSYLSVTVAWPDSSYSNRRSTDSCYLRPLIYIR